MTKASLLLVLLALAACTTAPQPRAYPDATALACAGGENTYACQVERYQNVSGE